LNGLTHQEVSPVRLTVVVMKGNTEVASQQLRGTLTNSFYPSYRITVPPGSYRVAAVPEAKQPWPIESRNDRVQSSATTIADIGCSGNPQSAVLAITGGLGPVGQRSHSTHVGRINGPD
jgi:hypothetical protein